MMRSRTFLLFSSSPGKPWAHNRCQLQGGKLIANRQRFPPVVQQLDGKADTTGRVQTTARRRVLDPRLPARPRPPYSLERMEMERQAFGFCLLQNAFTTSSALLFLCLACRPSASAPSNSPLLRRVAPRSAPLGRAPRPPEDQAGQGQWSSHRVMSLHRGRGAAVN
ncbi:hypothetical protein THAOC_12440 [Thalassiosira oceanica]|uniref:Uncharacterized protein n=1 Tax=Thalassiosira oceanica TaxID=159749 RepID=K0T854_THAOC|nr:hypothetical protein THAOC_12440 [Thalassiosira oceanica]|eukprot:EJK66627.1 hypothetical protein THAOC_12440 [Thalassiosira oceanica]